MKKMIALVMSGLLAVSAIGIPAVAEPVVPSVNAVAHGEWTRQAQPVSAEELAQVRSKALHAATDASEAAVAAEDTGYMTELPVTEEVLSRSETTAQSQAQDPVPVPVLAQVTPTMIVLEKTEGYEYSIGGGIWKSTNVFQDLSPNVTYQCYQRLAGNSATQSEPLTVTTTDRNPCPTAPVAPMVDEYTSYSINLVGRPGYEYRMNDGEWTTSCRFTDLQPDTEYTFYQRIKQTKSEYASQISEPLHYKTAHEGPSTSTHMARLMEHIETNGYEDEDGNKALAYVISDELGTEYYFVMTKMSNGVLFDVFTYSEAADVLLFDTLFKLGYSDNSIRVEFVAAYYSDDICVDYVEDSVTVYLKDYNIGDDLTVYGSGAYLSSEDMSALCTVSTAMLLSFWDEYIYDTLGFGFRGLGFVASDGYGDLACNAGAEVHFGKTVIKNQRETECLIDGSEGDPYCTLCGQMIVRPFDLLSRGYHEYDSSCDADCNDCGEIRPVQHIYSFACDTECDLCGGLRADPLAAHSLDENRVCTVCGHEDRLPGDVTGDGKLNVGDVAKIYAHIRGTGKLTASADLAAADVSGDGKINLGDVSKLLAHVSGQKPLW